MPILNARYIHVLAIIAMILTLIASIVNTFFFHYPGNNYLPNDVYPTILTIALMMAGCSLLFGFDSRPTRIAQEIFIYILIMAIIMSASNAIQYTPFPTIDQWIVGVERSFNIEMNQIIQWTYAYPNFKYLLASIYSLLPLEMIYIPLLLMILQRTQALREYYFLLLISMLLGFSFYYFFPTTAPASIIDSPYFDPAQKATYLKFQQIHHYIPPTTLDGGMISLPSFHTIWAWFCLNLLRGIPLLFILLLPMNLLLIASCVLLGWHYPMDILGSAMIIALSHGIYSLCEVKQINQIQKVI